jgi:hypothetical protein
MGAGDPPPAGAPCAVYLFDRNPQTDPAILTAMDLFRDALGIGEAERRMDERGVRECRAAQVECPFKDSDVAVRMLTWITPNDPAPAQALARFAADVGHMLRGNDARLGEYRALFDALAQLLAGTDVSQSAPDPAWARLGDIIRSGQAIPQPATAAADVDAAIHAIRDAAAEPARLKTDLVKRLVALAEKAFPERTVLLGQCRRLAKDARDTAGLLTPRFPARAALLEEVSAAAGRTLRLRYFHEADWRGELPLNPELVDYEKFRKVR